MPTKHRPLTFLSELPTLQGLSKDSTPQCPSPDTTWTPSQSPTHGPPRGLPPARQRRCGAHAAPRSARIARRSFGVVPPQIPSSLCAGRDNATSRHSAVTGHCRQMRRAFPPVLPTGGKNTSGSVCALHKHFSN